MALNKELWDAAGYGKFEQCRALVLQKADINWKNPSEVTAFERKRLASVNFSPQISTVYLADCFKKSADFK